MAELLGDAKDVMLNIAVSSSRGDCLSYVGIAGELCAVFGGSVNEMAEFVAGGTPKIAK